MVLMVSSLPSQKWGGVSLHFLSQEVVKCVKGDGMGWDMIKGGISLRVIWGERDGEHSNGAG